MAGEFQGGVCGDTWWSPNLLHGGGSGFSSSCSMAQLGDSYDMGSFGWPYETMKGKSNNDQFYDDNSLVIPSDYDSTFDVLGSSLSPTTSSIGWNQQSQFCKIGINEGSFESILQENSTQPIITITNYELGPNISTMMDSSNNPTQDGSPPTTMTTSSNTSRDSSTITTSFPMSSSSSYLIQTLFDDIDDQSQLIDTNDFGRELMSSPCSWPKLSSNNTLIQPPLAPPSSVELSQSDHFNGGMNIVDNNVEQFTNGQYNTANALSNFRASLLNSLQSRSRAPSSNQKSRERTSHATKSKHDEVHRKSKKNMNNNEEPLAKRPRLETPSPLPTFKVRKEKLGDRITALQQLVSPFGKTDTASVLHEAIEYINYLHDQVYVLSAPSLKNEAIVNHPQAHVQTNNNDKGLKQDLRNRGLCVVPISSTYPITQETPVDFWTPTFGGTTYI